VDRECTAGCFGRRTWTPCSHAPSHTPPAALDCCRAGVDECGMQPRGFARCHAGLFKGQPLTAPPECRAHVDVATVRHRLGGLDVPLRRRDSGTASGGRDSSGRFCAFASCAAASWWAGRQRCCVGRGAAFPNMPHGRSAGLSASLRHDGHDQGTSNGQLSLSIGRIG
jgi:hypothetical protein